MKIRSTLVMAAIFAFIACEDQTLAPRPGQPESKTNSPSASAAVAATPIQIYGSWHCGNDACTWATVRTVTEFDSKNHWLIDRDGTGPSTSPSVNLVVLSFVHPLKLLNQTTDAGTL